MIAPPLPMGGSYHLTPTIMLNADGPRKPPGKLLTHRWLLERVWGAGYSDDLDVLRVFISQLRKKIKADPARPQIIATDPGIGYRWLLQAEERTNA